MAHSSPNIYNTQACINPQYCKEKEKNKVVDFFPPYNLTPTVFRPKIHTMCT